MAGTRHRAARHRSGVAVRWGRLLAGVASATVTAVAVLAGTGVVGTAPAEVGAAVAESTDGGDPGDAGDPSDPSDAAPDSAAVDLTAAASVAPDPKALPADSGSGKRIVFDQSAQRVWLVGRDGEVTRTYLGSGSVVANLQPGTYSVYSKSRWAVGVDDSGVMQYFVRFTKGPGGAAIGFHTIPTKQGVPLQTMKQLGTPQSHGCIRQRTKDAIALWDFAPVGTPVVVVA
ncbi:L,D-transpeptidase [Nocardioides sp. CER19]|uniref:L,D-transpeptidase n=1 Tax=Nocardioides sp. CER19 TaxID=3038538 RepID=UPI0024477A3B|nr:L,D-transpeptidase [Nocardioides sp. CER19]MDH2415164.1 L,D-transpeptidase [Nocardioides sp. CER19]